MKKTLFAALALAFVASCSNEEVLDVAQKEAIGFDNAFVNNSTRSVNDPSTTTSTIADFAVYGFVKGDANSTVANLFNGVTVNKTIENSELTKTGWKYAATQYWIANALYNFSAVSPVTNQKWNVKTNTTPSTTNMELSFTNTGEQDLLYAQTNQITGLATKNEAVAFDFKHILSKVKFSFKNEYNATGATIKVKNIKITNAHQTGDVALSKEKETDIKANWSNQAVPAEGATAFVLDFGMATDDEATTEENEKENVEVAFAYGATYESQNERLLIPTTNEYSYNVTFTVELLVSGTLIKSYEHTATVAFTPVAGYSYDIKAIIDEENIDPTTTQEPIEFTATVSDWTKSTTDVSATVNTNTTTAGN